MLEIELTQPSYAPGEPVTGRVIIPKTEKSEKMRGLTVRVVHLDSSSKSAESRVDVVETITIPARYKASIDFHLDLPLVAQAGFHGKFGSSSWVVQASVDVPGVDLKATEEPFTVLPAPLEPLTDLQAHEHTAALAAEAKSSARKGRVGPLVIATGLLGLGLFFLISIIAALADDPTGREAVYLASAGLLLGGFFTFAGLWAFNVMFPRRNSHVSIELATPSVRMGDTVHTTVTVTKPGFAVGLVGVERYAYDNKLKKGHTVLYYDHVFHEEWRDVEPGTTELSFAVPDGSFATYGGTAVLIDWHVAVVPTQKRETHGLPDSNLSRVVVLY